MLQNADFLCHQSNNFQEEDKEEYIVLPLCHLPQGNSQVSSSAGKGEWGREGAEVRPHVLLVDSKLLASLPAQRRRRCVFVQNSIDPR